MNPRINHKTMFLMILMLIQTAYGQLDTLQQANNNNNNYNNVYEIQNTINNKEFGNPNQRVTRYQNSYGSTSLKKYKSHIRQPSFPTSFNKPPNYITKGRNKKPILLSQVLRGETSLPQYLLPSANNKHHTPSSSFPGDNSPHPYVEADTFTDSHPPPSYESNSLDSPPSSVFYSNTNNNYNAIKDHSNRFNGNNNNHHHNHNLDSQLTPPSGPTAVDGDFIFPPQSHHKNTDDVYFQNANKFRTRAPVSILSEETNNDEVILDKVRNNNNLKYTSGGMNNNNNNNYKDPNNKNNVKPTPSYLDKDIRALFNKIKMQNSYDDSIDNNNNNNDNNYYYNSQPTISSSYYKKVREPIETTTKYYEGDKRDVDRLKSALSKLLIPLLPEFTQIGNDNDRGKREEVNKNNNIHHHNIIPNYKRSNNTKIIYIMEENEEDDDKRSHKVKENGNTVFVVLTPSDFKAATNILSSNDDYINNNNNNKNGYTKEQYKQQQQPEGRNIEEAITAPTIENIALQKYIMSLAGLGASPTY